MSEPARIRVATGAPYDVWVGTDVRGRLPELVGEKASRVALIHAGRVIGLARELGETLASGGVEVTYIEIPEGESAKTAAVAERCWQVLGGAGFTRTDVVVGVGGGATTDIAGFVAATWLRGVRLVNVPTTVLGMVDAAVGGKTGINIPSGKNLVGAIHEPAGVLCDLSVLATLPVADLAAGLAEVVKCGFISDTAILDIVEADPAACLAWDSPQLRDIVVRAVQVKADVVADDLRESVSAALGRQALNYGHTFGHAIEKVEDFTWRHGDAISVGMVYVAELARLAGILDAADAERHRSVLGSLGLPTRYAGGEWDELLAAMRVDKKVRGDMLRFVILDRIGHPGILEGPAPELLVAAYAEVSA